MSSVPPIPDERPFVKVVKKPVRFFCDFWFSDFFAFLFFVLGSCPKGSSSTHHQNSISYLILPHNVTASQHLSATISPTSTSFSLLLHETRPVLGHHSRLERNVVVSNHTQQWVEETDAE
jgi:hypothetical protein